MNEEVPASLWTEVQLAERIHCQTVNTLLLSDAIEKVIDEFKCNSQIMLYSIKISPKCY